MYGVRKNTLVIDFSVLPIRPEIGKVQSFLEKDIKLQYADVRSIQLHHLRNCVLIEMVSCEIAFRYQSDHNLKRTMLCNNKEFRIPVYVDCDAVTVRVLDLSPSISDAAICENMLQFGEVISIRDEKWKHYFPGMSNGVRVLRINLFRDIPSVITIQNEKTMVVYPNQPKSSGSSQPGGMCSEPHSPNETVSATSPALSSPDGLFKQTDFPPINNQQKKSSSRIPNASSGVPIAEEAKHNDDDWTDVDDNESSSSTDYNVVTHKRRRTKKQEASETKKACNNQCSPNTGHVVERIIDTFLKEKVSTMKNKKG